MPRPADPKPLNRSFEAIGRETCERLSEDFHRRIQQDPVLSPLFPKDLAALHERFTLFLIEKVGGPADYTKIRGKQSLLCRHAHLSISTVEAERWLGHMSASMQEVGIVDPECQQLADFFRTTAQSLTDPFIPFYGMPLDDLSRAIQANPKLLEESLAGHSLLRHAIWRWDHPRVRMLLEHGAPANAKKTHQHGPLYWAANSQVPGREAAGKAIVELLIEHGADVNWPSGPGRCTPLHMAARRGHVKIAQALIDAGANVEARDAQGVCPLQRAINCRKHSMVEFLKSLCSDSAEI